MKIILIIICILFFIFIILFLYCSLIVAKKYDNEIDMTLDLHNRK